MTASARPEVPPWRLVATLTVFGLAAGLLLVFVHQGTQPTIRAHKAQRLREAIHEVLGSPDAIETLVLSNGSLAAPSGPEGDLDAEGEGERVYVGYDAGGQVVGIAAVGVGPGYQDMVRVMFGYDPGNGVLLGMKVLESRETPGLGDKIERDPDFVSQFVGARPPLVGVGRGRGSGGPGEIDMISGATISSRTVIRTIDRALALLQPALDATPLARSAR